MRFHIFNHVHFSTTFTTRLCWTTYSEFPPCVGPYHSDSRTDATPTTHSIYMMTHRLWHAFFILLLLCLFPLATTSATHFRENAKGTRHSKENSRRRSKQPASFLGQRGASLRSPDTSAAALTATSQYQQQASKTFYTLHGRGTLSPNKCFPVAFLQKTHVVTARFLESAKQAKEQVERCGGYHRVLLIDLQDRNTRQHQDLRSSNGTTVTALGSSHAVGAAALHLLQEALGPSGVVLVGSEELQQLFGEEWMRYLQTNNLPKFLWTHCDSPELVW